MIKAKLSSSSTISAASSATSVPLIPMATPTSACLREGASFTPSPVIATSRTARLQRAHQAQLVFRGGAREHVDVLHPLLERGGIHLLDLGPGDRGATVADAEHPGDRRGGELVVPGNHRDADAAAVALPPAPLRSPPCAVGPGDRSGQAAPGLAHVLLGRTSRVRVASTLSPRFLLSAPLIAQRTLWCCQPVASAICSTVAP